MYEPLKSRRAFLRATLGVTAGAALAPLRADWPARLAAAEQEARGRAPGQTADHEPFWFQIQQAFDIDRSIINLNSGGVSAAPRPVMSAQRRHLEAINNAPSRVLWAVMDPQVETVRVRLARSFGCSPDEMAITRNASESLQISLNGIDLQPGDEVLTTTQDYPRMINTIKQRALREGVVLKQIKLPTPAQSQAELYDLFEEALTPKTRAILVSHVINITGQIMPVRRICELARKRGIWSIVDGAHAFAQIVYNGGEIGCDMYGVSLHKWLMAPIGTGLLYVRKGRIKDLWPLTAPADAKSADIRKFEEIGTHSDAPRLAIAEALTFHEGIGPARKEARLRYLRDYWAQRVLTLPKARLHTNLAAEHSCAIGTLQLDGIDTIDLTQHLWNKHRIIVSPIKHDEFQGIRVTPNVFTTLDELDLFVNAIEDAAAKGLPAANIEKPK